MMIVLWYLSTHQVHCKRIKVFWLYNYNHTIICTVPQIPSGFAITGENFTPMNSTITFEWDLPQGMGPEVIVDYYLVFISPSPLSHPILNNVSSSPWDVTVNYNTRYSVNFTSFNCAGQSGTLFNDFLYGMLVCFLRHIMTAFLL